VAAGSAAGVCGAGRTGLRLQLGLEAQKLLEQSALPRALHALDDELQIAPGLVHPQAPAHFHQFAIARRKVKQARRRRNMAQRNWPLASLIEK
jgi:hypothetical protein